VIRTRLRVLQSKRLPISDARALSDAFVHFFRELLKDWRHYYKCTQWRARVCVCVCVLMTHVHAEVVNSTPTRSHARTPTATRLCCVGCAAVRCLCR
jgi:hypothetical protein